MKFPLGLALEAIMVFDRDSCIVLANDAALELYGEKRLYGKKCREVYQSGLGSCDMPADQCWLKKTFNSGQAVRSIVLQKLKDGRTRRVAISASPIRDAEKNVRNVVVILQDITTEFECHGLKTDFIKQGRLYEQTPEGSGRHQPRRRYHQGKRYLAETFRLHSR